jgi:type I restriction-modification system DNA methylase subunit
MPLFQKSVLNKFIKSQDASKIEESYQRFSNSFLSPERQLEIRSMKEEEYQDGFLDDLFVNILGYIKRPNDGYNLVREKKNEADSKKADGAILKNNVPLAVIELKGTDTRDLDKVTNQGFGYKNNNKECVYVITSNFEKLRFYIHNAVEHIEFNLFTLTKDEFVTLWLCLHSDNLLDNIPSKIKDESVVKEEDITKNLYKDYSSFKQELWQSIVNLNPDGDPLMFYKKTQKLIDRFLFIFFAEDAGLLPPNSISRMVDRWKMLKDEDAYKPLYEIFKQYFGYINTGRQGKTPQDEIFAYNGGLMLEDDVLDNILISDEILLKHVSNLTTYDFSSEVDVNILGHIFENSLNDIEAVTAQLEGLEIDKSKTKRKKDGVFYTPKYITKYIVDNTVGKLCEDKKKELSIIDEEYSKGRTNRKKETLKQLDENLQSYRNWLLNITICDPACGSGAFLNQALECLMEEHRYIDELESQLFGSGFTFPSVENHILENNIFGVDINEESIEIAKLSLWLRTAQRGRKLTSLNKNIKCGNSLIDDSEVAGEKAFNWKKEFPNVFEKGGFDVIIGNPPYVRQELFKEIKPSLANKYSCYNSISDLYTYFIELGIKLMSKTGCFSFILPNKFMRANYGKEVREVILKEANIDLIFDFDDYPVFQDATTYPIIFILSKKVSDTFYFSEINKRSSTLDPISMLEQNKIQVLSSSLSSDAWTFNDSRTFSLFEKLSKSSMELKEFVDDKIFRGVSTGCNEVFIVDKEIAKQFGNSQYLKKIFTGKEVKRYKADFQNLYLLFLTWDYDLESDDNLKSYLIQNKKKLSERPEVIEGRFNWWCLSRYGSKNSHLLSLPKIIYPRINNECNFFLDSSGEYSLSDNNFFISSGRKDLLAILNSKLIFFYLKNNCSTLQGGYYDFRRPYIEKIPIVKSLSTENKELNLLVDKTMESYSNCKNEESIFIEILKLKFKISKVSKKLENWYKLDFSEFLKELEKARNESAKENNNEYKKLSLSEEAEWMQFFGEKINKVKPLKMLIEQLENEINRIVYNLYGLTEDEILIVENA